MAAAAATRLLQDDGPGISFRELARAIGVTVPTLRHYFGDRDGVIVAAFDAMMRDGQEHVHAVAQAELGEVEESLAWFTKYFVQGWRQFGVGRLFGGALAISLGSKVRGPAYVNAILEPTLQALEARLAVHGDRGELAVADPRYAALALLSPVILALLHQDQLHGDTCRPLDIDDFIRSHIRHFLRAHAPR